MERLVLVALFAASCFAEKLIFQDDFNQFDLSIWNHELTLGGGGNWEFEYYTNNRSNSFVRDGVLYIKPTLTSERIGEANVMNGYTMDIWGSSPATLCTGNAFYGCSRTSGGGGNMLNPIQSARLRTVNSFNVKYGRLEVRAKMPRGDWIWPAIWMVPRLNSYGDWPASGEIDIVESRGNTNGYPGGVDSFGSTLHFGPYFGQDPFELAHAEHTLAKGDFADDFHVFGLVWTDKSIATYVDSPSNVVLNVSMDETSMWELGGFEKLGADNPWAGRGNNAPFDQEFYVIMNVAVGGTGSYFTDGVGGKPWTNADPNAVNKFWGARSEWLATWKGDDVAMQVDWIRAYSL